MKPSELLYTAFLLLAVETVTRLDLQSAAVGVVLASLGGGLAQMRRAERQTLTLGQSVAEWGLSGMLGFITYVAVMQTTQDPWLIWSACVAAGLGGSAALAKYVESQRDK